MRLLRMQTHWAALAFLFGGYMTNEEILANAPEGATHVDCVGTYYKYLSGAIQWQVWMEPEPESYWRTMPDYNIECATNIRFLSDIRRIATLEFVNSVQDKAIADTCSENYELAKEVKLLEKRAEAAERERDELLHRVAQAETNLIGAALAYGNGKDSAIPDDLINKFAIEQQIGALEDLCSDLSEMKSRLSEKIMQSSIGITTEYIESKINQLRQQLNG